MKQIMYHGVYSSYSSLTTDNPKLSVCHRYLRLIIHVSKSCSDEYLESRNARQTMLTAQWHLTRYGHLTSNYVQPKPYKRFTLRMSSVF